jgi:hypothetical protein
MKFCKTAVQNLSTNKHGFTLNLWAIISLGLLNIGYRVQLSSGEWCTWSTHASNVFKSQQNPTKQNYQKQTKYTFTESRRLNQAIMNQKTSEISNGQSALSYASKVIPKVHSSYFKFFSEKDKIMAIPYFHSIFSSDCQQS